MNEKSPEAFRTISEVAEWLGVPTHVLRFWESRFAQVKPIKRAGGRRYYRPADMELLGGIRKLLHDEGMTIRGVQKVLREKGVRHVCGLSPSLERPVTLEAHANVVDLDELQAEEDAAQIRDDDTFAAADAALSSDGWSDEPALDAPEPAPAPAAAPLDIPDDVQMAETAAHPAPDMAETPDEFMAADSDATLAGAGLPETDIEMHQIPAEGLPEAELPTMAAELPEAALPEAELPTTELPGAELPEPEAFASPDLAGMEPIAEAAPELSPEIALEAEAGALPDLDPLASGDPAADSGAAPLGEEMPVPDWDMSVEPEQPVPGADIAALDVTLPEGQPVAAENEPTEPAPLPADDLAPAMPELETGTELEAPAAPEMTGSAPQIIAADHVYDAENALPSSPEALDFMAHEATPETYEEAAGPDALAAAPVVPDAPELAAEDLQPDLTNLSPVAPEEVETPAPEMPEMPEMSGMMADAMPEAMAEPPETAPDDLADLAALDGAPELPDMPGAAEVEAPAADMAAPEFAMDPAASADLPPMDLGDTPAEVPDQPGLDTPAAASGDLPGIDLASEPDAADLPPLDLPAGDATEMDLPGADLSGLPAADMPDLPDATLDSPALSAPIAGLSAALDAAETKEETPEEPTPT
ncbi:MAG: MerR family transcriptional regulator, partial [Maritimibacter sp.]